MKCENLVYPSTGLCGPDELIDVRCSRNGKIVFGWEHSCCVCVCESVRARMCIGMHVWCVPCLLGHLRAVARARALSLQALPGPHYYTWGDHGGIIVAIAQGMETNELK